MPQDPSMAQLRQLITEYCILPVGSHQVQNKHQAMISTAPLVGVEKAAWKQKLSHLLKVVIGCYDPLRSRNNYCITKNQEYGFATSFGLVSSESVGMISWMVGHVIAG